MRFTLFACLLVTSVLWHADGQSSGTGSCIPCSCDASTTTDDTSGVFEKRTVVTDRAMGARCAVAADLDGDGDMDVVSASALDNAVLFYLNDGTGTFTAPQEVTYKSNGARIVTTGDIDGDGRKDIIVASYYDHTVAWFKNSINSKGALDFGDGIIISDSVLNAQGVTVGDIDSDGDLDVISASSGDNSIAWYENLGDEGRFCEVKRMVDHNAVGARTVVAADFDGDGDVDLASASKDDDTLAWYPNSDGKGLFNEKRIINSSALGAYSLYPIDVDQDGWVDLLTASNKDNVVGFYRNKKDGTFEFNLIYDNAAFVLSVYGADLDGDGDIDAASASYVDGKIRWYRNNGDGTWTNYTIYEGKEGHYVSGEDLDGDGDTDLIGSNTAENLVAVFTATTACTAGSPSASCCRAGQEWDGASASCVACAQGKYGTKSGAAATCVACPTGTCAIEGLTSLPLTCTPSCPNDIEEAYAECDCAENTYKNASDACEVCPDGQIKPVGDPRTTSDYSSDAGWLWQGFNQSLCEPKPLSEDDDDVILIIVYVFAAIFGVVILLAGAFGIKKLREHWIASAEAENRYKQLIQDRIDRACAATKTCMFNVCFIKYTAFKAAGKLVRHELHREQGNIISLDTYEEVFEWVSTHSTMFVSHQWLGFTEPDPDHIHFPAICSACETICSTFNIDEDKLYIWVDYISIPQMNNYLKGLSIASLAVYASVAKYFVICAPKCMHKDKQLECNADTYQRRGWCRLEQWARMTVGGLHDMYLHEDGKLQKIEDKPDWYEMSIKVFEGDFTVDDDKWNLVDTVMGLWYVALLNESHMNNTLLKELVEKNKDTVFPKKYFMNYIETLEKRVSDMNVKGSGENHHAELIRANTASRSLNGDEIGNPPAKETDKEPEKEPATEETEKEPQKSTNQGM